VSDGLIEENVVAVAGRTHRTRTEERVHLIPGAREDPGPARHALSGSQGLELRERLERALSPARREVDVGLRSVHGPEVVLVQPVCDALADPGGLDVGGAEVEASPNARVDDVLERV
jgi:hypothetical protein